MFVPLDEKPRFGERPEDSRISPSDWGILANFWYPIAINADVQNKPLTAKILDVDLVIFRGDNGAVAVALDMCPHRHVALSGGRMVAGELECPFHGLRFAANGQCQYVPALGKKAKLPASYRLKTYPAEIRYGLVWTCIGDPTVAEIPALPTLADADPEDLTYARPEYWPMSAPRQIENFVDLAHLPFVHANTLGGDQDGALKPGRIEETNDAVILHAEYVEHGHDGENYPAIYRYRIILPFTIDFTVKYPNHPDRKLISVDFATPSSANSTLVFQVHKADGDADARAGLLAALDAVNREDITMLSSLRRTNLPLDQHHEIHLPVDNVSGAYRKRLRDFGLGRTPARADGAHAGT